MKASRMIELLAKTIKNHGDLEVVQYDRLTENDGMVSKVVVRESNEYGEMPYECSCDDYAVDAPNTQYVVLMSN